MRQHIRASMSNFSRVGDMAQQLKTLAAKSDDLRSIPGTYVI